MTSGIGIGYNPQGSLSGMPGEIMDRVISFHPDSVRALRAVSRELNRTGAVFLQWSAEEIIVFCSDPDSPLHRLVRNNFIRLVLGPQADRMWFEFHGSIPGIIRSLGIPARECPDRILSCSEVEQFDRRIQDLNLQRLWERVRFPLFRANPLPVEGDVPASNAAAFEIRTWMHTNTDHSLLQDGSFPSLFLLGLTSVPMETELFGNIRQLNLPNNQLTILPRGLLRGMTNMEDVYLHNNQLVSLPEEFFFGLTRLQCIRLDNNRLISLPGGLFSGLVGLQQLHLDHNQLLSVPANLFTGLVGLQQLYLDHNQLLSVPADLFNGLSGLQCLFLDYNQLTSLPGERFDGLSALRTIGLSRNELLSCPPGIFARMTALRDLYFGDNPGLLFTLNTLPNCCNHDFAQTVNNFFNYEGRSSFARFYQLAAGTSSQETVRDAFAGLHDSIKNPIFWLIWAMGGRPMTGDPQWGEHHAFDDMQIFHRALRRFVRGSFDRLTPEQRPAVYGQVYLLARSERAEAQTNFDDPQWGERHADNNVLRLIDAMSAAGFLTGF